MITPATIEYVHDKIISDDAVQWGEENGVEVRAIASLIAKERDKYVLPEARENTLDYLAGMLYGICLGIEAARQEVESDSV